MDIIKVIHAEYIEDYKISLTFSDGKKKVVDLKDELWGEMFEPLNDINYFKNFTLNPFTIEWENGADFSPEFLHEFGEPAANKDVSKKHAV